MRNAPDALVKVTLFPCEQGGRIGPTPEIAFGCIMMIDGINLDVRFRLGGIGPLRPGAAEEIEVSFADVELAKPHLRAGAKFRLREASVIGEGEILEVFAVCGSPAAPVEWPGDGGMA